MIKDPRIKKKGRADNDGILIKTRSLGINPKNGGIPAKERIKNKIQNRLTCLVIDEFMLLENNEVWLINKIIAEDIRIYEIKYTKDEMVE